MTPSSRTRIAMGGIGLGSTAIALAYVTAFLPARFAPAAPWLMAAGLVLLLPGTLWLAAGRKAVFGIAFLALVLAVGLGVALAAPPESAGSALLLGLPRRAALLLYGVGLLPGLILPVFYALTFDRVVLSESELAEARNRLASLKELASKESE